MKTGRIKRFFVGLGKALFAFFFTLLVAGAVVATVVWRDLTRDLPEDLTFMTEWIPPSATTVLDRNGEEIDVFYREKRIWVPLDELPSHVPQAFIVSEDDQFRNHRGVDLEAIARAAVSNYRAGGTVQGGSTITQQVVKNVLLSSERSYTRKAKEAILAMRLEEQLSKDQILELYLNLIPLGSGTYGVEAAAQEYFGVSARSLDVGQAALLAGLAPAPSRYSPHSAPELAWERRSIVLGRLQEEGHIDDLQRAFFESEPVAVHQRPRAAGVNAAFVTAVRREARRLLGEERARDAGVTLRTGFDPAIQAAAVNAVRQATLDHLERQGPLELEPGEEPIYGPPAPWSQGAAVVVENATGQIVALVGGTDSRLEGFVRATQARRQPGSSFKPIVYATAMKNGREADSRVTTGHLALPGAGGRLWTPGDHVGAGRIPLRRALALSSNTAAVRLLLEVGSDAVVKTAHDLGVRSPLRSDATLALGSSEVTPLDMAMAYSTIARLGIPTDPVFISGVLDHEERVLGEAGDEIALGDREIRLPGSAEDPVLPPGVAWETLDLLREVVRAGTGWRAKSEVQDRAGKTGTTNDAADAWFVGMTPRHTVAVWIGTDGPRPLGEYEGGGRTALPAWVAIVEALGIEEGEEFPIPSDALVDRRAGQLRVTRRPEPDDRATRELGDRPLPPFPAAGRIPGG